LLIRSHTSKDRPYHSKKKTKDENKNIGSQNTSNMNLTRKLEEKPIWTTKGNSILLTIDIHLGIICTNHPLLVITDFKAPKHPLSLRLKVSGCHYNSIYNNTWTKQVKQFSKQHQTQWSKCQKHFYFTHW
jgi:hypothetical protein